MTEAPLVISARKLTAFTRRLLAHAGLRGRDAALVADTLVHANLRGIDSHGVARLRHYLQRIERGGLNPRPRLRVERLAPGCARVDGDHGPGQVVMHRAARTAVALARETGAGWVAVRASGHCGALDYFGLQIARAGMIGWVFTHADSLVLPFGSRRPFCGTNPLCIAIPGPGREALCLDMATGIVAWNVIANAAETGARLPAGWAVDAAGRDTTRSRRAVALHPAGAYKGSGLGLMIDALSALLGGAPFGPDIPAMYEHLDQPRQLGGLVGALDVRRFVPVDECRARVGELLRRWQALPPARLGGEVLFPGERETRCARHRSRNGIPLPAAVAAALNAWCQEHGLSARLEAGRHGRLRA